ncbi:hypothetical protein L5G28_07710 [Gordonia sp. HY285]|uniref:hypothetical protein n=1 Tax=Gordonia liuliyuniae TaxID=2911517 RepID=UPI001F34D58A|nr:hypothetical protein [Gordonia liuliyuniae]MCF8610047.1 hypothetical protein [Gordonia liuliyuniae]
MFRKSIAAVIAALALTGAGAGIAAADSTITQGGPDATYAPDSGTIVQGGPDTTYTPDRGTITQGDRDPDRRPNYESPGVSRCPKPGAVSNSWTYVGTDDNGDPIYQWVCIYPVGGN